MNVEAVQGNTYNFSLTLAPDSAATYVKMTMVPANSEGGMAAFEGNPDMQKIIELGDWGETADGDQTFDEYRPSYDMKEFKSFPGVLGPTTNYFPWVAPTTGRYFMVILTNCDEPVLDDVQANMNVQTGQPIPGHEGASSCHGEFTLDLHAADMSLNLVNTKSHI